MARTITINERTGESFPRKSMKKRKDKKYFGNRYGNDKKPNAKKNVDFMNDGYPLELRHKSVIKNKILEEVYDEMIEDLL